MGITKIIGYSAAIIATVLLGSIGFFVRNISANGFIITFARLCIGLVFLIIFLFFKKEIRNILSIKFSFSLLSTGCLLAMAMLCYMNAIISTTLINAVFLLYLGPLIAVGIAAVFLKEKFTFLNGGLICLAFLGFLFLLEFDFSLNVDEFKGYLWGMGSAVSYALYIVFNRKIPEQIPALTRSFYQLLFGALTMLPFLDDSLFSLSTKDLYWLTAMGFFQGFLAFPALVLAVKHLKSIEYGTISYSETLVASLIGWGFFSESLTLSQFFGCAIVFSGGMIQVLTTIKNE
ncbi:MAG: DMT family transporter [Deltaproteobacteria bacterium]|nr:DMT family transporter [Deltaproteobacteria bacterium]